MIKDEKVYSSANIGMSAILGTNAGAPNIDTGNTLPVIDIRGNEINGLITVNTGLNPTGENIGVVLIPQQLAYDVDGMMVVLTPANRQAIGLHCAAEAIESRSFELNCTEQLEPLNVYQWYYQIIQVS